MNLKQPRAGLFRPQGLVHMMKSPFSLAPDAMRKFCTPPCRDSYGGRLVFLIKMGPPVADASAVLCKPAYGGNVYIYYSLDSGDTGETLTILETFSYRKEDFTEVSLNKIVPRFGSASEHALGKGGTLIRELTPNTCIVCLGEIFLFWLHEVVNRPFSES